MLPSSGYSKCDAPNSVYYNLPFWGVGGDFLKYLYTYLFKNPDSIWKFRVSKGTYTSGENWSRGRNTFHIYPLTPSTFWTILAMTYKNKTKYQRIPGIYVGGGN